MLLGVLGTQEIILILGGLLVLCVPIYFIYKYGKQKGRIQEMERERREREKE